MSYQMTHLLLPEGSIAKAIMENIRKYDVWGPCKLRIKGRLNHDMGRLEMEMELSPVPGAESFFSRQRPGSFHGQIIERERPSRFFGDEVDWSSLWDEDDD